MQTLDIRRWLPEKFTVEEFNKLFADAWEKGITYDKIKCSGEQAECIRGFTSTEKSNASDELTNVRIQVI